jgi:hypothetical protein
MPSHAHLIGTAVNQQKGAGTLIVTEFMPHDVLPRSIPSHATPRWPVTVNSGTPSPGVFCSLRCLWLSDNASVLTCPRRATLVIRQSVPRYETLPRISSPHPPTVTATVQSETILIRLHENWRSTVRTNQEKVFIDDNCHKSPYP